MKLPGKLFLSSIKSCFYGRKIVCLRKTKCWEFTEKQKENTPAQTMTICSRGVLCVLEG